MKFYSKKIITRDDNLQYMIRYTLFTCPLFSIKVHNIRLSDYDCMHDHPWAFISLIFRGGYVEHTPSGAKLYGAGSVLFRPAQYIHKLQIFQPAWTLVITFKKTREWGFYTPSGWVKWFRFRNAEHCNS